MRTLVAVLILALPTALALAQTPERDAVENAAMRYSLACGGHDLKAAYEGAATELRLAMRMAASMISPLTIADADDVDGFAAAVRQFDAHMLDEVRGTGIGLVMFTRVVDVEVKDATATCYVAGAPSLLSPDHRTRDHAMLEPNAARVLITGETKPGKPKREDATHILTLRKDGGAWKVSMAVPLKPPLQRPHDDAPGGVIISRGGPDVAASTVLAKAAGKTTIGAAIRMAMKDARTYTGADLVDFYGDMSDGFKAFLATRRPGKLAQDYIELSVQVEGDGRVYLINADEPALCGPEKLTDRELWALMVEYAEKQQP